MKEFRKYGSLEMTSNDERLVEGYASLFNTRSVDLGGFVEQIAEGAFEDVIERSTVLALMNHDDSRGILARCVNGNGSLKLEVDERGLKFSFSAPNTPLGDECLEMIKRGDMNNCSFAFTVAKDTWEKNDGTYLRTINKIDKLYDISLVYDAAYPDTSVAVAQRSLEKFKEQQSLIDKELEEIEKIESHEHETVVEQVEETQETQETQNENNINNVEEVTEEVTEVTEEVTERQVNKTNNTNKQIIKDNKHNNITMEKFSLVKAIRSIVDNRPMDEVNQMVLDAGRSEMRGAGVAFGGSIQLPMEERAYAENVAGVAGLGQEVIETEKFALLAPLTNKLIFTELGATYLNVTNNISVPKMSSLQAGWAGEVEAAMDTHATFDTVEFSPKRISAYIDISKTLLYQDGTGVEAMIRNQIVEAVAQVLESTILGDQDKTVKKPAGIFYNAATTTIDYASLLNMEETLEKANVSGDFKYVVSPEIKTMLKTNTVGGAKNDFRFLLDGGETLGHPTLSTNNSAGIALADWSNLWITTFGGADIVVDTVSQAVKNCVRIVINMNVDAKFVRPEAVVAKTVVAKTV